MSSLQEKKIRRKPEILQCLLHIQSNPAPRSVESRSKGGSANQEGWKEVLGTECLTVPNFKCQRGAVGRNPTIYTWPGLAQLGNSRQRWCGRVPYLTAIYTWPSSKGTALILYGSHSPTWLGLVVWLIPSQNSSMPNYFSNFLLLFSVVGNYLRIGRTVEKFHEKFFFPFFSH